MTILIHIRKKALQFYVIYSGKIETYYRGHSYEQQIMETQQPPPQIVTSPLLHNLQDLLMRKLEVEGEQKMKLPELKVYDNYPQEYIDELDKIIASGEREFERVMGRKMTAMERRKIYG